MFNKSRGKINPVSNKNKDYCESRGSFILCVNENSNGIYLRRTVGWGDLQWIAIMSVCLSKQKQKKQNEKSDLKYFSNT